MTLYLSDPDVTLYQGDALAVLRELPAESVRFTDCGHNIQKDECVAPVTLTCLMGHTQELWNGARRSGSRLSRRSV